MDTEERPRQGVVPGLLDFVAGARIREVLAVLLHSRLYVGLLAEVDAKRALLGAGAGLDQRRLEGRAELRIAGLELGREVATVLVDD